MSLWPQYLILFLMVLGLGFSVGMNGKPRTGVVSFWVQLVNVLISFTILAYGGFFDKIMGW